MAHQIDLEIRRIIEEAHERARGILRDHREQLDRVAEILIRRETLERSEFEALLEDTPEKDVFHDKDVRARRRQKGKGTERGPRTKPTIEAPPTVEPVPSETA